MVAGAALGIVAPLLTYNGNPGNMGFCAACFLRDTAGALGLHRATPLQYLRPELIGLVLGAFSMALCFSLGGGCPGKQLVNIGEGNNDAALFVLGMVLGATAAHNFALAASPAGVTQFTPYVLVIGFVVCLYIGITNKSKI
ncbi:ribosomal protein L11 methyltransferase [Aggregatibacter actinomycetemcomitans serotype d str. SA3033]|nr:ribosomal protein L11 methyltransferase [Aggregatibacter actinomycetemcomitans serotype e str. SA2876]KYK84998.1 ribosomal protein L11 methyltransferase [Aggregatibacter actinomycetemcomitans serotype d str. SA3033]KYK90060.1 ribosomal protein L11 methyltransferase [Aggregatibacter actinomycetemcomitans serotype d str. SA2200]